MEKTKEQRKEERLECRWPVWCAKGFGKTLYHGQMLDISSQGLAFTCRADKEFPGPGQQVTIHFSVPRFGPNESSNMTIFTRISRIHRVEDVDGSLHRVAVQFDEPLAFEPSKLEAVNLMLSKGADP